MCDKNPLKWLLRDSQIRSTSDCFDAIFLLVVIKIATQKLPFD